MSMKCFVMMPSGNDNEYAGGSEESNYVFTGIIRPALIEVLGDDATVIREADKRKPGAITTEIVKQIAEFDVAVVDITGQNPNVFLELGIRYALRRSTTILLKQKGTPFPFDIHNFRCIEYKSVYGGPKKAREDIKAALQQAKGDNYGDSLVFDVYPNLEVTIPNAFGKPVNADNRMPWSAYRRSLSRVIDSAVHVIRDGRYVPITVIGITNGGAMFADLLGRDLFGGAIPIVSLWANRNNHSGYFDNEINKSAISGVVELAKSANEPSILLVDDIVASGTTQYQALEFLKTHTKGVNITFLPLFSRNEKYIELTQKHILWKHPAFNFSDKEIRGLHTTDWSRLPYDKDIRAT